jgi:hypothetical protein
MITEMTRSYIRFDVDGRGAMVEGEALLPGHGSPDFVAYTGTLRWDDGAEMTAPERRVAIESLVAASRQRSLRLELEG